MALTSIEPRELARRLAEGPDGLVLLDVREPGEVELGVIQGSLHIPLGELPRRVDELDPGAEIVCICHHGVRSARAAGFLASRGFEALLNLSGGVEAWAVDVDASFPRY